jgi:hypothetical protein
VYSVVVAVLLRTAKKLLQEVQSVPCSLVGSGEFPQNFFNFLENGRGKRKTSCTPPRDLTKRSTFATEI